MIIYKITNKLNGKLYIGQTVQKLHDRWSDHARPCLGKNVNRSAIGSAIRLYGKENFTIEQIDSAETLEQLNTMEITYIKAFNTLAPNGYNLELGGESKACHDDTKAKISATLKGRPIKNRMNGAPKGRPVSAERRAQISATLTGKAQPSKYKTVECSNGVTYESVNAAAKALNVNRVTISSLIKSGKVGRLGFIFKFK
jgi:group I intron endonuclease